MHPKLLIYFKIKKRLTDLLNGVVCNCKFYLYYIAFFVAITGDLLGECLVDDSSLPLQHVWL